MGSFKLGKMTLRSLFSKPATVKYPYEKRDLERLFPAMRGHVECDIDTCILCGMCQRACPVGAITVARKESTWSIDPYRCIQCACCTHECPKDCLRMDVAVAPAVSELTVTTLVKPAKEKPAPAAKAAGAKAAAGGGAAAGVASAGGAAAEKPARPKVQLTPEQQARVEAARARKAARDAEKAKAAAEANKAE